MLKTGLYKLDAQGNQSGSTFEASSPLLCVSQSQFRDEKRALSRRSEEGRKSYQATSDMDKRRIFTFHTTHHALWAEEVAQERGIPAEVIPAPPAAHARCNLAIETLPEDVERLSGALEAEGVPHALWSEA